MSKIIVEVEGFTTSECSNPKCDRQVKHWVGDEPNSCLCDACYELYRKIESLEYHINKIYETYRDDVSLIDIQDDYAAVSYEDLATLWGTLVNARLSTQIGHSEAKK